MIKINNVKWFITLCCKYCDNGKGIIWVTIIIPQTANFAGPTLAQRGSCQLHIGPTWAQRALLSGSRTETWCLTWQANSGASFTITFKKMMMRILHMKTTLHMFPSFRIAFVLHNPVLFDGTLLEIPLMTFGYWPIWAVSENLHHCQITPLDLWASGKFVVKQTLLEQGISENCTIQDNM